MARRHEEPFQPTQSEILASLRRRLLELLPTLDVSLEPPSRKAPWDLALRVHSAGKTGGEKVMGLFMGK